jgi:hypothetical protein
MAAVAHMEAKEMKSGEAIFKRQNIVSFCNCWQYRAVVEALKSGRINRYYAASRASYQPQRMMRCFFFIDELHICMYDGHFE